MNWARQQFFPLFFAILGVGIAGLGYLVYSSYSRYSQVSGEYQAQVTELNRLQHLVPYPNGTNLNAFTAVTKTYATAVKDLQKQLAAFQPPSGPAPSPLQFQDRLRHVVEEVTRDAGEAKVALPDNFYLGFEQYREKPPDPAAAADLSAELDAIRDLVDLFIRSHVEKINVLKRAQLKREISPNAVDAPVKPGSPAALAASALLRESVQVEYTASPSAFRETINQISAAPACTLFPVCWSEMRMTRGQPALKWLRQPRLHGLAGRCPVIRTAMPPNKRRRRRLPDPGRYGMSWAWKNYLPRRASTSLRCHRRVNPDQPSSKHVLPTALMTFSPLGKISA